MYVCENIQNKKFVKKEAVCVVCLASTRGC